MKRLYSILLFIIGIVFLISCTQEDREPQLYLLGGPNVLSPTVSKTLLLTEATVNDVAEIYTWANADFGYKAAVTYTLQFAQAGKNLPHPSMWYPRIPILTRSR